MAGGVNAGVGGAMRVRVVALVLLAAGALSGVAGTTASADPGGPTEVFIDDSGNLVAQAQEGVANDVTVGFSAPTNQVVITDTAGAVDKKPDDSGDPRCHEFGGDTVACDVSALVLKAEPPSVAVLLSDVGDIVRAAPSLPANLPFVASGGGGQDFAVGGPGNDFLYGGGGRDRLNGGDGDDVIGGEDGDDVLRGQSGNDLMYGNAGHDKQLGGAGRDWIWTADKQRDQEIDCGADRDQAAIVDHGLDPKPVSC
jgi:Ca2+-binding RTX toxin-like protein